MYTLFLTIHIFSGGLSLLLGTWNLLQKKGNISHKKVVFNQKKMMGGLCFNVNEKMCCGIHFDKKKQLDLLMARIGP